MFEIEILEIVYKKIELNYLAILSSRVLQTDVSVFDLYSIGIKHSFEEIFEVLRANPYTYPKFNNEVYFACHTYLPFILFYKIENCKVVIMNVKKRESVLEHKAV